MIYPIQNYLGEPGKRVIPLPAFWILETAGPVTAARLVLDDPDLKHTVRPSSHASTVIERMAEEIHGDLTARFAVVEEIVYHLLDRDDVSEAAQSIAINILQALDLRDDPTAAKANFEADKVKAA